MNNEKHESEREKADKEALSGVKQSRVEGKAQRRGCALTHIRAKSC